MIGGLATRFDRARRCGMPSVTLAANPNNARVARRFVEGCLEDAGVSSWLAMLLTSELVANVIRHAPSDFDLVVSVEPAVIRIEVHDGVAVTAAFRELLAQPPERVSVDSQTGRGLVLMKSTTLRYGLIDKRASGKAIWFEVTPDKVHRTADIDS
jgi:anti-sigma regulatory factor (Ser/Thr protein kinase)